MKQNIVFYPCCDRFSVVKSDEPLCRKCKTHLRGRALFYDFYSKKKWEKLNDKLKNHGGFRYNGGVKCDMTEGPCACGAWH